METDVVIVGYGAAGAAAAITAHDAGSEAIVLEKMAAGGGNSRLSIGAIFNPKGPKAVDHIETLCFGKTGRDIIEVYVAGCAENCDWIAALGGKTERRSYPQVEYPPRRSPSWPNIPGIEDMETFRVADETPDANPAGSLWRLLESNVVKRGIRVMTGTPARELVTERGEVVGVLAESEGGSLTVRARKGVILTCGGFEYNEAMKDAYLSLTPLYPVGGAGNTGDGLIMAQKVGAAMWHMSQFYGWFVFKPPEYQAGFTLRFSSPSYLYIDKDARRFTSETGWEGHEEPKALMAFSPLRPNYPHLPIYAVFDEVIRKKGPLYRSLTGGGAVMDYKWSLDNSREIKKGWINRGKNLRELARRISVDEVNLSETLARYNDYCRTGRDLDFNRSRETLLPIEQGPFYAIELGSGIAATSGGPRRDAGSRVLNEEGKPIPRLYSAGELGSIWGFMTMGGSGLTEALVFGRIAGRNAASESPWL